MIEPRKLDSLGAVEDKKPWGSVRGKVGKQEIMLDLRQRSGNAVAFAYSYLFSVLYNPSEGISLEFGAAKAVIKGRNLRALYEDILNHAATYVQEGDPRFDTGAENEPFVEEITVERG